MGVSFLRACDHFRAYVAEKLRGAQYEGIGRALFAETSSDRWGPRRHALPFSEVHRELSQVFPIPCLPRPSIGIAGGIPMLRRGRIYGSTQQFSQNRQSALRECWAWIERFTSGCRLAAHRDCDRLHAPGSVNFPKTTRFFDVRYANGQSSTWLDEAVPR